MQDSKMQVGGQAIIEGVMMRSPERVALAVRRSDGKIVLKNDPYISLTKRNKFWGLPIIRGGVVLIESLVIGIKALTFSGDMAMAEEQKLTDDGGAGKSGGLSNLGLVATLIFSLGIGLALFFYLPLLLTELVGAHSGFMFNLIDGIFRMIIFLLYLFFITLWKDIRRIFQYHGAEHKTIFAFEDGKELNIANVKTYRPHHPRCGTSFILTVLLVSIFVFMLLGRPESATDRLLRLAFVPVIGGLSYEAIKLSDRQKNSLLVRLFIAPGLWLQKITAREPDDSMLEVAIVAMKGALGEEFKDDPVVVPADALGT
ncbi:MAG: DUF1385 domain-containing protein [candidate division KSB1 bacterium]|nr:DUF1385 domain-containing protein [candidate division KSB1 bacterium]MDZ7317707.1 DUF1385 domain-containing protein [candidate division KSB1 bacterium]MDZ7341862.1 DUF1385 domain-containing protein [candidate division KSB1 bacterium]